MSVKRKLYKSEFKAKVALAAVRGDETSAQLSSKFGVHSAMVNSWRRILVSNAANLFEQAGKNDGRKEMESTMDELYRQIGQLKVERDFLSKRSGI